jgi:8-oxo-dGTP diphosphatase
MIKCEFENGNIASPGIRHVTTNVIVVKDNKLLMVKRAEGLLEAGKWGLVGGYVDRDETIVEGARREVFEESGWEIDTLTLLKVNDNPDRPHEDRQNIDFIFFTNATQQTGKPDDESEMIEWYDLNSLPPQEQIAFDHADAIAVYKKYLSNEITVPVL